MVDSYRAVRQFERMLGGARESSLRAPYAPVRQYPKGKLIATVVYNLRDETVTVVRPGDLEHKLDD